MRIARRLLLLLLLLTGLVMPGTAHAAPTTLTQAEWENALNAEIDQSGAFAPGTTFLFNQKNDGAGESLVVTVRPDGSMHGQRTTPTNTTRIRCVRVDRCWEQSPVTFGDNRWHRTPSGTVTYANARALWMSTVVGLPWPEPAMYLTETMENGHLIYMVGSGNSERTRVTGTTLDPGQIGTMEMIAVGGEPDAITVTEGGLVTDAPIVKAPAKATIGEPARQSDPWTVPINPPTG